MDHAHRFRFIPVAMLLVHSSVGAPAMAQQDDATLVSKRAVEVHQASKFSEAMPLAQRALAIPENALGPDHPGAGAMTGFDDPVFDAAERAKAVAEWRKRARVDVARGNGGLHGTRIDRAKLAQYRVLYCATDGFIAGEVAGFGEASLVPSLPKQRTDSADWVVLSAYTTVAADKPGAGAPSGLARAFFDAGAVALLVSHWSVNSEVATRLAASTLSIMTTDPKYRRDCRRRNAMLAYMDGKGSALNASGGRFPSIGVGEDL
jgi:CHAT domain-containing protein